MEQKDRNCCNKVTHRSLPSDLAVWTVQFHKDWYEVHLIDIEGENERESDNNISYLGNKFWTSLRTTDRWLVNFGLSVVLDSK